MTSPKLTDFQLATLATLQLKLTALGVEGDFQPTAIEGPIVTLYKFSPRNATRVSQVERLAPDLAIALGVEAVQIRRVPGEAFIGIAVPNRDRKPFLFRDAVSVIWQSKARIPICLGISQEGNVVVDDLTNLPHLLIAGSTNSGKSTLVSSILTGLVYTKSPSEIQLLLSDTKQVEFGRFEKTPHLARPIATSVLATLEILNYAVDLIEDRLGELAKIGCKNIAEGNHLASLRKLPQWPYYVIVIDELADPLSDKTRIEIDEKDVSMASLCEHALATIVARARATGVHVIAGVQRPSVKIVEGNIKSNFPARVSFRLPSEIDSRTVLGTGGAEHLLSQGDMLYLSPLNPSIRRIHAPLAKNEDMNAAVEMAKMGG